MTIEPDALPPLVTQADVHRAWQLLIRPLGFSRTSIWVMLIHGDDRPEPQIVEIDDLPHSSPRSAHQLVQFCVSLLAECCPRGSMALLLSRPGRGPLTAFDLSWAHELQAAASTQDLRLWPLHVADDTCIRVVTSDDLAASG